MLSRLPQLPVYAQLPITLVSGKGAYVYDETGTEYLDMYGGHAVAITGHCHSKVVKAICNQAEKLMFYSNIVDFQIRRDLCEKLAALGPPGTYAVFLCNSGAEANENALTLARLATRRAKVVSIEGGFHGRTFLTLSISGIEKYRALSFLDGEPIFKSGEVIPFGHIDAARRTIDDACAAVIIEPIQGLNGCIPAEQSYLSELRKICSLRGALLIFDEVQCGMGRCGAFTVGQRQNISADLVTLAKGLGGGFPIAAVLISKEIAEIVKPGELGTTFGGGPMACAAALATLDVIEEENMIENARDIGDFLMSELAAVHGVKKVQGAGMLIGIVLDLPASEIRDKLLIKHRIISGTSAVSNVLRILPPLNLNLEQAQRFISSLSEVLSEGKK